MKWVHTLVLVLIFGLTACGGDTAPQDVSTDSGGDVQVSDADAQDNTVSDPGTPDPGCIPQCENKDCGPNQCGGLCGLCAPNSTCTPEGICEEVVITPPDPQVCSGNTKLGEKQNFGGACCYTAAGHPQNPNCVWYAPDYGEGECIDNECGSGYCASAAYCSKGCSIYKDELNNATGEGGFDGVNDEDAINECEGAVDGPFGTNFQCVNLRPVTQNILAFCRPGTTFEPCENSMDCPIGESCQLIYISGGTSARCMTIEKDSVAGMEECNSDPNSGPITSCQGPFCFGSGCVDLCADDSDCITDTCVEGACAKTGAACTTDTECSAWRCEELTPYSDSDFTDDFCQPRDCAKAEDCVDPDWFCRPFWNGAETVEEVAFSPACRRLEEGAVGYGEACGEEGDGTGLPPCAWAGGCIDNYCAGPCSSDADCGEGAECLLGAEWNIDVDDNDSVDTTLNVDLCQKWPHDGELQDCSTDADCPADHHCRYRVKANGEGSERVWAVEYKCRKNKEEVGFGEICGGSDGPACKSDLCLVPSGNGNADAMCTETCTSAADCPETVEFDGFTWKTLCLSFNVNGQNTLDPIDDIFVPYCWRTSSIGSVEPCDAEKKCSDSKEYCRAAIIAGNVDEAVNVDHICIDSSEGLDAFPIGVLGDPCTTWSECNGRICLPDASGNRYCSELCSTDDGCTNPAGLNLKCTENLLLERPDPSLSGWTQRCVLQETCLSCDSDQDCGGDHVCVNDGGLGALADFRCGAPCIEDADCTEPDTTCQQDIGPTGAATGKNACLPASCGL